ncbi:uncharacterized protein BDCG_16341 [Blastomyces dermatitidis ER-3]|uniref:Uncharacterized protein n=1 Tax=Ajellomyces dermatitidis (strain ER-3 / ATCC MYA-2586) TaxID=559297 RepID=A0ABX2VRG6_AJEDR|nr:uncharacterized protein BDCG_16341 [Blastomyces dermatitidis ER-3]OAS99829.1 hypothetical protein BDCG_16341 [Blastomyces dermatitidis ER-3]
MSSLFKYSAVLRIIKARECCHRLKREKKKYRNNADDATCERLKKKTNIEKTVLLSEHVNLLTAEVEPETADQKMWDFEMQVDLAEEKQ